MQFKDANELNNFLATRSYIEGFHPSQADVTVFDGLKSAPGATTPHAARWYRHIASFDKNARQKFPKGDAQSSKSESNGAVGDEEEEIDLFGDDDEEDAEKEKIKEERLKAYADKKAKKPALIAKSSVILDVKPWDDETDLGELEKSVRSIQMDGLVWGASKLVPVAFGIKKLQIMSVVEDEKVSVDQLVEDITAMEDFVQSVDIAAFNKI